MRRILIIGSGIIDKQNATGITLRSIFDGIDSEYLMGVTWGDSAKSNIQSKFKVVHLSYRLLSFGNFLDNGCFKKISCSLRKSEVQNTTQISKNVQSKRRKVLSYIRQRIALLPAESSVSISKKDWAVIGEFSPQVIYTLGESVTTLKFAYKLSKVFNIPIVIHFMDNWRHSIEWAANPLLGGYQKRLTHYCDLCYSRSNKCIAIGERMAEIYENETGVKHNVVMNSIDTKSLCCTPRAKDGIIRFVYAGGLHLGREQALRAIGEAIDRIFEKSIMQAMFSIYTSEDNITLHKDKFVGLKYTKLYPSVPHEEIINVYQQSDVLVHVESDALVSNEFFKYSVSTKISEYLATGLPFLFWGPRNIYLYDFLKNNKLAYTASNIDEVDDALSRIAMGKKNEFGDNARQYAASHFDISVARMRFQQTIDNVHLPNE